MYSRGELTWRIHRQEEHVDVFDELWLHVLRARVDGGEHSADRPSFVEQPRVRVRPRQLDLRSGVVVHDLHARFDGLDAHLANRCEHGRIRERRELA